MLIDSHCHLDDDQFENEQEEVIQRARLEKLLAIITVGTDKTSIQNNLEIAKSHDFIYCAAGIHPHEADDVSREDIDYLEHTIKNKKTVAVGETGLDYYKEFSSKDHQKRLFLKHIELFYEFKKPIVIHCRNAHKDCYEILRSDMPRPSFGVMHCFSGSKEMAKKYLDLGLCVSIAGPVTFPNASDLQELVRFIPLDRLIIETDAPYLAPQEVRGKRNEPSYIKFIAKKIADILGMDPERIAQITSENSKRLFKI
jgi:TatD DNase family protein